MSRDLSEPHAAATRVLAALDIEEHDPIEVDGFAVTRTLRPRDAEELGRSLAQLEGSGLGVLVRGGASALHYGNPPRRADLFLSTERIAGVEEFDAEDGVIRVRAGTPLASLRETVEGSGWEIPLDPPGRGTTLGGCLARAAVGPRELGFGPPRRAVLGLDVVLAGGVRTHCGGRVVKNVTGFDLAKLYTGSLGTLGVIDAAWLRLRPRSEAVRVIRGGRRDQRALLRFVKRAARRTTARAAAVLCPGAAAASGMAGDAEAWHFVVELAGEESAVSSDAAWILEEGPGARRGEAEIENLRDLQGRVLAPGGLRARLTTLSSRQEEASAGLCGVARAQLLYPGQGTLFAYGSGERFEAFAASCREFVEPSATSLHRGSLCFEALSLDAKRRGDVFGEPGPERKILAALKRRFDPEGLLNPGRFQGRF